MLFVPFANSSIAYWQALAFEVVDEEGYHHHIPCQGGAKLVETMNYSGCVTLTR